MAQLVTALGLAAIAFESHMTDVSLSARFSRFESYKWH